MIARVRTLLRASPLATAGLAMLTLLLLAIAAAPLLAGAPPDRLDVLHMLRPPSAAHPFGTDMFGRDVLSRVLYGGRATLAIGVLVVASAFIAGVTVGTIAGFFGGLLDSVIMRLVDALLSFPALVLAIALAAAFGPSLGNAMMAISITLAPQFARVARAQAALLSTALHVEAARCIGIPTGRILVRYILRNGIGPLLTQATLSISSAILQTASLGFLGLGAQPPLPEWGADIAANLETVRSAPWVALAPGLAILLTVLSFNLIGDSLGALLDPRQRRRSS
ncbi:ABC transporter permease [Lichenicola cladoniae]|uniref:ABC transporter permease n=1 Tax=Lichenicola cladoniae TaxID=1484109 RepID=A0A6M8GYJ4_9PROT|nr:ABC transporter permease [Lichenicola cladoniae]NPD65250.1 ABC transporter permease [Acetobacteraceae bacterium]QKE88844.1 ABC transporter permease [Lichenicola cladoniae]